MSAIEMQELLEAGMHFGHLTRRWNPKMKPFIYGVRNGVHIIDLSKTARQFQKALDFIKEAVGDGADILFVGTKKQAQDNIREEAVRCKMFYVNQRWLGGTLTNYRTIKASIQRLKNLQKKKEDGTFSSFSKKELLMVDREIGKLLHALGGIQDLTKIPGVMVVVDPSLEHIALHEAKLLGVPVVALADTNCDPDRIDYVVPGNDDALRSIQLFLNKIADEVLDGLKLREMKARQEAEGSDEVKPVVREVEVAGEKGVAYVSSLKEEAEEGVEEGQYSAKAEETAPSPAEAGKEKSSESVEEEKTPEGSKSAEETKE